MSWINMPTSAEQVRGTPKYQLKFLLSSVGDLLGVFAHPLLIMHATLLPFTVVIYVFIIILY